MFIRGTTSIQNYSIFALKERLTLTLIRNLQLINIKLTLKERQWTEINSLRKVATRTKA